MITVRCSKCKGAKGYTLGDIKTDCPHCLGTGLHLHDSVSDVPATPKKSKVVKKIEPVIIAPASDEKASKNILISNKVASHEREASVSA